MVQAAKVAELLKKRLKVREDQHIKQTDTTSLPPAWFALREPGGLSGARASLPRFRSAPLTKTKAYCLPLRNGAKCTTHGEECCSKAESDCLVMCHTHLMLTARLLPAGACHSSSACCTCRYKGGYWEARDAADWTCLPQDVQQIFAP